MFDQIRDFSTEQTDLNRSPRTHPEVLNELSTVRPQGCAQGGGISEEFERRRVRLATAAGVRSPTPGSWKPPGELRARPVRLTSRGSSKGPVPEFSPAKTRSRQIEQPKGGRVARLRYRGSGGRLAAARVRQCGAVVGLRDSSSPPHAPPRVAGTPSPNELGTGAI